MILTPQFDQSSFFWSHHYRCVIIKAYQWSPTYSQNLIVNLRTTVFKTNFVFCAFFANFSAGILFCLCCCISRTIFSKAVGCSNPDKTSDMIDPAATSVHHNGQDSHSQRRIINSHTQQHHESSWRRVNDSTVYSKLKSVKLRLIKSVYQLTLKIYPFITSKGRPFWFDEITGESRWTDPHHCNSKAGTLPIDWEAIFDSKSRKE